METLIYALRAGSFARIPETEGVLVEVDGATVTLTLDDGETLSFDAAELAAAQGFLWANTGGEPDVRRAA